MSEPHDAPDEGPFVEMTLRRIVLRDQHDSQMIYLTEQSGERSFAISIGRGEAEEMRRVVGSIQTERPLTHQLTLETIQALGGALERVEINDLKRNTFYARLVLRTGEEGGTRLVDARSSDAIALALRAGCPIRVAESVLQQVRIDLAPDLLAAIDPQALDASLSALVGEPGAEPGEDDADDDDADDDDADDDDAADDAADDDTEDEDEEAAEDDVEGDEGPPGKPS